ncbi:MAG: bacteriohemerythrin [Deferribacterales bacterium]|jgi:hemerythrin
MTKKILPEAMKTNITFIDEEHSALIGISEELIGVASQGGVDRLKELLDYLRRYTETHFQNEEQFMMENGYGEFDFHKEEHNYFIHFIETSAKDLKEGNSTDRTMKEIMEAMKDWIVEHINKIDLNMTASLNK